MSRQNKLQMGPSTETVLTNYRLQLGPERGEVLGTLVVRDGIIARCLQPGGILLLKGHKRGGERRGDYLRPGLVSTTYRQLRAANDPTAQGALAYWRDGGGLPTGTWQQRGLQRCAMPSPLADITPTSIRMTQFGPMIDTIHQGQTGGALRGRSSPAPARLWSWVTSRCTR